MCRPTPEPPRTNNGKQNGQTNATVQHGSGGGRERRHGKGGRQESRAGDEAAAGEGQRPDRTPGNRWRQPLLQTPARQVGGHVGG